ncbi:ribosomal protein L17 [Bombardia bombarda]|uniref:Large ribosomal subunit protein bL17m n=1 Tax=Bombardia bombarda TaxID=252184 RepID=A0AA39XMC7_9PEZI|nr:ribosomal protein L17 [Bombardia bombarda]
MAGGHQKYRHLSRSSAHRQALLRNLVSALIKEEAIHTTYPKAKEAQRMAEKVITLAKRNNETARRKAQGILYRPFDLMPKLFGELRERYLLRPGGYTRVLRTEPIDKYSQAPAAILELVDGPKDMRFAMTAATVARDRQLGNNHTELTRKNMAKVTRFRENGVEALDDLASKIGDMGLISTDAAKGGKADKSSSR